MRANPSWWTEVGGLPPRVRSSADARRRLFAGGFLLLFVIGTTGVAASIRQSRATTSGMEQFCTAYRDITIGLPSLPPKLDVTDLDPDLQAGVARMEHANLLARTSRNPRVVATFTDLEREISRMPTHGTTPEQGQAAAERSAQVFVTSFRAAVEECSAAGYPVIRAGGS